MGGSDQAGEGNPPSVPATSLARTSSGSRSSGPLSCIRLFPPTGHRPASYTGVPWHWPFHPHRSPSGASPSFSFGLGPALPTIPVSPTHHPNRSGGQPHWIRLTPPLNQDIVSRRSNSRMKCPRVSAQGTDTGPAGLHGSDSQSGEPEHGDK